MIEKKMIAFVGWQRGLSATRLAPACARSQMHAALIRRHQRLGNDCARAPLLCWWEKRRLPQPSSRRAWACQPFAVHGAAILEHSVPTFAACAAASEWLCAASRVPVQACEACPQWAATPTESFFCFGSVCRATTTKYSTPVPEGTTTRGSAELAGPCDES